MSKNMMKILGGFLAGIMVLSGCAAVTEMIQTPTIEATLSPTLTPTSAVTATPEATATAKATATTEATATDEVFTDINHLFTEKGTVQSEHVSMRVSKKSLENIGIPNGFTVDSAKLEDARKLFLSRWSWALAKGSNDPRLAIFKDVDQINMEAMLKAYDDNAALGNNGFDYVFDFGYAFGGGTNKIEGKVDKINISMTNDPKEWDGIVENLKSNNIGFTFLYAPSSRAKSIFYFGSNGSLEIIFNGQDPLYPSTGVTSSNLSFVLSSPMVVGEGGIEQAAKVPGSWTDPQAVAWLFGCDGPDFCSIPGSSSDFKY